MGATYDQAAARLTAAGFTVARTDVVSTRPAGSVTATNPASGTQLPGGAKVTVSVAKPGATQATMPDLRGSRPRDAITAVEAAGLTLDPVWRATYVDPYWDNCRFLYSTPPAGTAVARGTQVSLQYGCG
ncbi:PASTA domain-containing protein [Yinghuangia sp. KLBMP8922]|uniref:PASTA domain-containing protein n=1 Tax=Yinghuangia soli TaxID=2908204 RepID=A0AA41PWE4_9ACTN|nr:PASTA domain-containing protein [Yinghuangia soli]